MANGQKVAAASALTKDSKILIDRRALEKLNGGNGRQRGVTSDTRSPRLDHAMSALEKTATAVTPGEIRQNGHSRSAKKVELQAKLHKLKNLFWPDNMPAFD